jgi:D-3-phosphoglycerate dehydrogenase
MVLERDDSRFSKYTDRQHRIMPKVAITTTSFAEFDDQSLQALSDSGFEVALNPYGRKLSGDEVIKIAADAVGLIAGTELLDKIVLEKLPLLKVISRCGAGLDNVDLDTAEKLGIKVFNTPDAPTLAVAELTIGLILNLLRKVHVMNEAARKGIWEKKMGNLLSGKKVGIIGFGRIGQKVGELLSAFGVELRYCDVEAKDCKFKCGRMPLDHLLSWADIITLHVSLSAEHKSLISRKELEAMKKGGLLINVSRGGVVDEQALYNALYKNHLSGAALDVFEREPYKGPLTKLDNIIITPHIGSYAAESRIRMEFQSVENLLRGLEST